MARLLPLRCLSREKKAAHFGLVLTRRQADSTKAQRNSPEPSLVIASSLDFLPPVCLPNARWCASRQAGAGHASRGEVRADRRGGPDDLQERRSLTGSSKLRRFDREFGHSKVVIERGGSFKKL